MRCLYLGTLAISVAQCVAATACDDDGSGTTPGSGGSTGTTTSGTGTGTTTTTGGGGSAGGPCYGDPDAWAQIQKENIPCAQNSDCCVVFQDCIGEVQVVSAGDYGTAAAVWPYCGDECVQCMLPIVEVQCHQSECVGYEVPMDEDAGIYEGQSHCGVDEPMGMLDNPGTYFTCI